MFFTTDGQQRAMLSEHFLSKETMPVTAIHTAAVCMGSAVHGGTLRGERGQMQAGLGAETK